MSMISMQVDRLRDRAMRVEVFLEGSTDAIPTDTHKQLRDAADTIWDLRNKCNDLMDKRDELRHENADMKRQLYHADEIIGRQGTKIEKTESENAKLRELVRHMGACIQHLDRTDEDGGCVRCPYQTVEHDCGFEQRMAELGIEVD